MEDRVYTVREFAKLMKISESTAYKFVKGGQVRSVSFGDRRLIPASVVSQLLSGESQVNKCQ